MYFLNFGAKKIIITLLTAASWLPYSDTVVSLQQTQFDPNRPNWLYKFDTDNIPIIPQNPTYLSEKLDVFSNVHYICTVLYFKLRFSSTRKYFKRKYSPIWLIACMYFCTFATLSLSCTFNLVFIFRHHLSNKYSVQNIQLFINKLCGPLKSSSVRSVKLMLV